MERSLLWSALAVGVVGLAYACLSLRARRPSGSPAARPFVLLALALPLLVFAATLPSRAPWSSGQALGRGFVLGALGAAAAAWLARRGSAAEGSVSDTVRALAGAQFAAVAVIAIPALAMHAVVVDALCAVAIGWLCVALCLSSCDYLSPGEDAAPTGGLASAGALFAITLAAAALVAVHRDALSAATVHGPWAALALALGASIPVLTLLVGHPASLLVRGAARVPGAGWVAARLGRLNASPQAEQAVALLAQLAVGAGLFLVFAWLLGARLVAEASVLRVAAVGLVAGLIVWWLLADEASDSEGERVRPMVGPPALALLAVVAGYIVAGQMLQGLGVALTVLSGWLPLGLAVALFFGRRGDPVATRRGPTAVQALGLGTLLVLFRLFMARYAADLKGVSLTDGYALFGFLVGALLPAVLVDALSARRSNGRGSGRGDLARFLLTGVLAVALPGAIVLLWGAKCALALLAGLALGTVTRVGLLARSGTAIANVLLSAACGLVVVQWTGRVLPLAEMTRADKVKLLAWVVGAVIVLIMASEYAPRIAARLRSRRLRAEAGR